MTSNIGSEYFNDFSLPAAAVEERVRAELKKYFRPEFLNRIDETVVFSSLRLEDMGHIVDIQVQVLKQRLQNRKVTLELTSKVRAFLAEKGYSPEYGARPLKRMIERVIANPLSVQIIEGRIKDGDKVVVDLKGKEIVFNKGE